VPQFGQLRIADLPLMDLRIEELVVYQGVQQSGRNGLEHSRSHFRAVYKRVRG
jgi:hypothetical protein